MNIQAIVDFRQHLDQYFDKVMREECDEEKIKAIAQQCFPDYRMACEITICETIMARLEHEFELEVGKETSKKIPRGSPINVASLPEGLVDICESLWKE